jgi:hypothetical protein
MRTQPLDLLAGERTRCGAARRPPHHARPSLFGEAVSARPQADEGRTIAPPRAIVRALLPPDPPLRRRMQARLPRPLYLTLRSPLAVGRHQAVGRAPGQVIRDWPDARTVRPALARPAEGSRAGETTSRPPPDGTGMPRLSLRTRPHRRAAAKARDMARTTRKRRSRPVGTPRPKRTRVGAPASRRPPATKKKGDPEGPPDMLH